MKKKDITEGFVDFGDWANIPPWENPPPEPERSWMQRTLTCRGCKNTSLVHRDKPIMGLPVKIENGWIMLNVGWMCEGCVACPICAEVMFEQPQNWGHTVPTQTEQGITMHLTYESALPCDSCWHEIEEMYPEDA